MGLDMYLSKKTYVKQWSHNKPENQFNVSVKKGKKKYEPIKPERVSYIVENVGYWRKFNALHNWFVNECAGGVDECQPIYVSDEKMNELLETLKKVQNILVSSPKVKKSVEVGWSNGEKMYEEIDVIENDEELEELFPTASGFFFGGTEYGEYYKEQVSETIELIETLLSEEGSDDYEYQASW
jgi:hypothetical protein